MQRSLETIADILHYLAVVILGVMASLGAAQSVVILEPGFRDAGGTSLLAPLILLASLIGSLQGVDFTMSAGTFLFVATLALSLMPTLVGLLTAAGGGKGLSLATLAENWPMDFSDEVSFGMVLGATLPCFLGLLAGPARLEVLSPGSLWGSSGAAFLTMLLCASATLLFGAVADRNFLRGEVGLPLDEIVWTPSVGILVCCLSQAAQSFAVAPWLLRAALCRAGAAEPLARLSVYGEPLPALAFTAALAVCLCPVVLSLPGSVLAPPLTAAFLFAHFATNARACALGGATCVSATLGALGSAACLASCWRSALGVGLCLGLGAAAFGGCEAGKRRAD